MSTITEKIQKLLALSQSPYEAEAKAALLKARRLMAEHKLRPEDIEPEKEKKLVRAHTGVRTTKLSTPWAIQLSRVIAAQYCCRNYYTSWKGRKIAEIGFVGFEEDFEACKLAFCYAHESIMARYQAIRKEQHGRRTAKEIRQMCSSYGWGFCSGLKDAFDEQTRQHQEWGLVMVVPKAVNDVVDTMQKATYAKPSANAWDRQYASLGYQDGLRFQRIKRLNEGS